MGVGPHGPLALREGENLKPPKDQHRILHLGDLTAPRLVFLTGRREVVESIIPSFLPADHGKLTSYKWMKSNSDKDKIMLMLLISINSVLTIFCYLTTVLAFGMTTRGDSPATKACHCQCRPCVESLGPRRAQSSRHGGLLRDCSIYQSRTQQHEQCNHRLKDSTPSYGLMPLTPFPIHRVT